MILITLAIACPGLDHVFKVQTLGLPQLMTVYGLAFLNIPVIQLVKAIREKLMRVEECTEKKYGLTNITTQNIMEVSKEKEEIIICFL